MVGGIIDDLILPLEVDGEGLDGWEFEDAPQAVAGSRVPKKRRNAVGWVAKRVDYLALM